MMSHPILHTIHSMASFYDEVNLTDMVFQEDTEIFQHPCPCGDKFFITVEDLFENEDKAKCPSCSLILKVNFNLTMLEAKFPEEFEKSHDNVQ